MNKYTKPFRTLQQQVDILKQRGMEITDENKAKSYLGKINYYRLSAYWHPFRLRQNNPDGTTTVLDKFQTGLHFSTVLDLYVFDKKLRLICLDALERVEIALRTDITIELARIDPYAHRDPAHLHGHFSRRRKTPQSKTKHEKWLQLLDDKAKRSQEDFAKHFRGKYPNAVMPTWVASELWDFGALSHLYQGLLFPNRDAIAARYGVHNRKVFQSWIRSLNDLRNICAHHSRLWNKPQVNQPMSPNVGDIPELDHLANNTKAQTRIYSALLILRYLVREINPSSTWCLWLIDHLDTFPDSPHISLKNAGFPDNWKSLQIWN